MGARPSFFAGWRVVWRSFLSLLLLFSLVSCGRGLKAPVADRGEFDTYFQRFEKYSTDFGRATAGDDTLTITFSKLAEEEAGRCQWNFFSGRHVFIDPLAWKFMDDGTREALILHELGHCLLRRDHVEGMAHIALQSNNSSDSGNEKVENEFLGPKSLMNPSALPSSTYFRNQPYYLKELFLRTP